MNSISSQAKRLLRLFQMKQFDVSTEEGRSSERYRRVALTTVSAGVAKVSAALVLFVSVPLTLSYLGPERYGLWMTIGSVVTLLIFSDLGIGNGLVNAISEAHGKEDIELARRYVSSAFVMLTGIALVFSIGFAVVYPWLPWQKLFNIHSSLAIAEAGPATAVFFVCYLINIPLGIVNRIQIGYQQGFVNNLWVALGNLLALVAVVLACRQKAPLPWLVLAITGTPILATSVNAGLMFGVQQPWLRPSWRLADINSTRKIFKIGIMFFVLQLAVAVGFSSDNVVIAQMLGASAVTQYSVPAKMFSLVSVLIATILAPLWPAYGEAISRGEIGWVRKTLRRSLLLSLSIAVPANFLIVVCAHKILHLWVGNKVTAPLLLLVGFGLLGVSSAIEYPLSFLLNAANAIRFRVIVAVLMASLNLSLSIYLTRKFGILGPVWGSVIAFTLVSLIPCAFFIPRLLRSMDSALGDTAAFE